MKITFEPDLREENPTETVRVDDKMIGYFHRISHTHQFVFVSLRGDHQIQAFDLDVNDAIQARIAVSRILRGETLGNRF